jgi:hypothetical protein
VWKGGKSRGKWRQSWVNRIYVRSINHTNAQ